jgi:parallel beta-helix repeat protein
MLLGLVVLLASGCDDNATKPECDLRIIVVKPDGTGDFPTIQAAIDAAEPGDIIELTDGTFTGDGNRDIDFLGKAITVRSRSGNREACIIDCQADSLDPHRGFVFRSGEGVRSVLEGLTVTNGFVTGLMDGGGGILCTDSSSPTIDNCSVSRNNVRRNEDRLTYGGGICCIESSPLITRSVITLNDAQDCYADGGHVIQCGDAAGGIYCYDSSPMIEDNVILETGTGITCAGGLPRIESNTIQGNFQGIMIAGGSPEIRNNSINENERGIALTRSAAFVVNNRLSSNAAWGIYVSSMVSDPYPIIDHNIIDDSITIMGGNPIIISNTILGDVQMAAMLPGSPMKYCISGAPTISRNIVVGSIAGECLDCRDSNPNITCNNVWNDQDGLGDCDVGEGNFSADPLFCDPDNGDYRLQASSPCHPESTACGVIGALPVGCE